LQQNRYFQQWKKEYSIYQFVEHWRSLVTARPREYHRLGDERDVILVLFLFLEYLAVAVQVHVEGYFGVRLQKLLQVLNFHL
jgi:hypothetical protein